MAIRDILHYPDPRLRNRAEPVEAVDDGIRELLDDMLETMYAAPGIGLAAIQVNVPKRVVTIDISEQGDQPLCLVNPEILELTPLSPTEIQVFAKKPGVTQVNLWDENERIYTVDGLLKQLETSYAEAVREQGAEKKQR